MLGDGKGIGKKSKQITSAYKEVFFTWYKEVQTFGNLGPSQNIWQLLLKDSIQKSYLDLFNKSFHCFL